MELLAKKIVENQIKKGKVKSDEEALYQYGYQIMLEKAIAILMTIAVALILNAWVEVLVFCASFISIRIYAGGFHAKSTTGCLILSSAMLVGGIVLNEILFECGLYKFYLFIDAVVLPVICICAPLEHKNRAVSVSEKRYFKRMVSVFCLLQSISEIVLCVLGYYDLIGISVYAHCVIAISLLVQKKIET